MTNEKEMAPGMEKDGLMNENVQNRAAAGALVAENGLEVYYSGNSLPLLYTASSRLVTIGVDTSGNLPNDTGSLLVTGIARVGNSAPTGYKLSVAGNTYIGGDITSTALISAKKGLTVYQTDSTAPLLNASSGRLVTIGTYTSGSISNDVASLLVTDKLSVGNSLNTSYKLSVSGNAYIAGNITASGEITAYTSSDIRLKKDVAPVENALSIVERLSPVSYNWNEKAIELNPEKTDKRDYGLIAQELSDVLPELVKPMYDGEYLGVDYPKLIPFLIAAIKELKGQLNELKNGL